MNVYSTRSFPCPCLCGKEFTTYNESQNHINYCSHSPYRCNICDKGFIDEGPFLAHLAECHPVELLKYFNKIQQPVQQHPPQFPQVSLNSNNPSIPLYTKSNFCAVPPSPQRDDLGTPFIAQGQTCYVNSLFGNSDSHSTPFADQNMNGGNMNGGNVCHSNMANSCNSSNSNQNNQRYVNKYNNIDQSDINPFEHAIIPNDSEIKEFNDQKSCFESRINNPFKLSENELKRPLKRSLSNKRGCGKEFEHEIRSYNQTSKIKLVVCGVNCFFCKECANRLKKK